MKINKMLSLAAAMVLTSTAAMAFDTNTTTIQTLSDRDDATSVIIGGYTGGNAPVAALASNADQYGDALIYPAFQSANGWESEFSVRNTSGTSAVVAKVVVYGASKSEELLDFNIYLSDKDVFKFTIKDGIVSTVDSSTAAGVSAPNAGVSKDSVTMNTRGTTLNFNTTALTETEGYVVVYGMAQAYDDNASTANSGKYHENHKALWADYRKLLDDCRPNWRNAYVQSSNGRANFVNGMMVANPDGNFTAPNVLQTLTCGIDPTTKGQFAGVQPVLVGMTRISNSTDASRDMMLPATALDNFTDVNSSMVLWAEGEFASLADRGIAAGQYVNASVVGDANLFNTVTANVEFNQDKDSETTLLVTQPYKRNLVQLGDTSASYSGETLSKGIFNGAYGSFKMGYIAYDLEEGSTTSPTGNGPITSPYTGGTVSPDAYKNELQAVALKDMLEGAKALGFTSTQGFADVTFTVPAIITQMNGGEATGDAQTNWTYTPSK